MWRPRGTTVPGSVKGATTLILTATLTLSQAYGRIRHEEMPPIETSTTLSGSSASTPVNVKLLLIGNASVGKSSLLLRFSDEAWIPEDEATATIGVDFRVSGESCSDVTSCGRVTKHGSLG